LCLSHQMIYIGKIGENPILSSRALEDLAYKMPGQMSGFVIWADPSDCKAAGEEP
jgi:hypothetical protein